MTKDIETKCKHCGEDIIVKAHWPNSLHFVTCNFCGEENKIELNSWKIKNKIN